MTDQTTVPNGQPPICSNTAQASGPTGSPAPSRSYTERASAIGGHIACGHRNYLDRAIFEGRLTLADIGMKDSGRQDTPPTALGTWAHWYTQCALRAQFKSAYGDFAFTGFDEAYAQSQMPEPRLIQLASSLFSSPGAAQAAVHNIAGLVIQRIPGKTCRKWLAECAGNIPGLLTGHIDLLSADLEHLVDIKTTGQPPEHGVMKPDHMWQLVAYALLVVHHTGQPPHYGHVMYVDRHGEWVCRSKPIDFQSPQGVLLMNELLEWLKSRTPSRTPVFGPHCDSGWCPYRAVCRDLVVPGSAAIVRRHEPVAVSSNPFTGTPSAP